MIAIGEMGIGNTTAGTAIAAVFTGRPVEVLTGRGTGIDDRAVLRKREAIRRAIAVNRPDPADPIGVLAKVGGLEIAGMAGAVLGAAAAGIPVVLDGMISTAAALAAARLLPEVSEYLFASHLSAEPAHRFMLEELGLRPLIDADDAPGRRDRAVLCFPLIDGALSLAREMGHLCRVWVWRGRRRRGRSTNPTARRRDAGGCLWRNWSVTATAGTV